MNFLEKLFWWLSADARAAMLEAENQQLQRQLIKLRSSHGVPVDALRELVSKWARHNSSSDERGEGFSAGLDLCAMQLAALIGKEA